jgi:DNA polymerase-3 subunit epsilon
VKKVQTHNTGLANIADQCMYAIIDIETTGGSPSYSKITEIAIILHDGQKVIEEYSTLINPECSIPYQITQLTGISNEMVRDAPPFYDVAKKIIELTKDAVFVAHNVNFDYNFVKAAFKDLGYDYHRNTLCTVRLSRHAFPGFPSYSLGKLCDSLNIQLANRHRALGDAKATAILFDRIIKSNTSILDDIKNAAITIPKNLPPQLKDDALQKIPVGITGVYYFHNTTGDVIYVGKSNDIKKRIIQHFASGKTKKSARMLEDIAHISIENTGSELIALLLESDEIKKLKPIYNTSQKRSRAVPLYSIYDKIDEAGYVNLYVDRHQEERQPLTTIDNGKESTQFFERLVEKFNLCLAKCDLHKFKGPCFNHQIKKCNGACLELESPEAYNKRVTQAIETFSFQNQSFFLIGNGRVAGEKSMVCIERGLYKGFGYFDTEGGYPQVEDLRHQIKKYSHNRDIQQILSKFIKKSMILNYEI